SCPISNEAPRPWPRTPRSSDPRNPEPRSSKENWSVKAVRFHGPGTPLSLEEVPDPSPGPQEVVVRVEACGVCASDLHFIHGELPLPAPAPLTLGHEPSGVIAALGSEVPFWREGTRVAMFAGRPCLRCRFCAAGLIEE